MERILLIPFVALIFVLLPSHYNTESTIPIANGNLSMKYPVMVNYHYSSFKK